MKKWILIFLWVVMGAAGDLYAQDSPDFYKQIYRVYREGKYEEALTFVEAALSGKPDDLKLHHLKAKIFLLVFGGYLRLKGISILHLRLQWAILLNWLFLAGRCHCRRRVQRDFPSRNTAECRSTSWLPGGLRRVSPGKG